MRFTAAVLLIWASFAGLIFAAVAPTSIALANSSNGSSPTAPYNLTNLSETYTFSIPGTSVDLNLSNFHGLLGQGELDLCVIEGLGGIFDRVGKTGPDGGLPFHSWTAKYGNVVINVDDFAPPTFVMTYATLVTMLRGIALFASQHGYVQMRVGVYDHDRGHVGTGDVGLIIPPRTPSVA